MSSAPSPESQPEHLPGPPDGARVPIRVTVSSDDAELAADRLFQAGVSAVSEVAREDGRVDLIADPEVDALASLEVYFGPGALHRLPDASGAERDPASTWQDHAEVLVVGDRLVVRPEWLAPSPLGPDILEPDILEVVVAAADAFGSGSHPTTRLCLELVDELVTDGARVLDVGSGSGVLAVAAALLGASEVRCHDIAPEAVEATARSAASSGVADRVRVSIEPVELADHGGAFDLVLANLLVPIIEDLGPTLRSAVAPGGHLVLSGLLVDQRDRAVAACAPLAVVDERRDGDWVALVLRGDPSSGEL